MIITIDDKRHLQQAAKRLLDYAGERKLFAFYGAMGAGKTTIIKSVCALLGAADLVTSPTFTLVNEYRSSKGDPIYHIDFYRIKSPSEVYDFGIEDYLAGDYYCLMEWPELIGDILPPDTVQVRISVTDDEVRILDVV